jgi:hypothetical protein
MRVVAECHKTRGIEARHRIGKLNGPRCLTPFWRRRGPELEMVGILRPTADGHHEQLGRP